MSAAADAGEIKRAWRARLMDVHPDHGGTAAETMEVQAAYEVLSDATRRAAYDLRIAQYPLTTSAARSAFDEVAEEFDDYEPDWSSTMNDAYSVFGDRPDNLDDLYEWLGRVREAAHLPFCAATTKAGRPCMGTPYKGGKYCYQHSPDVPKGVRVPRQCTVCGMMFPLRGASTCWDCSTATQRAQARSSTPGGQCISKTKSGIPCRAAPMRDGFCYGHWISLEAARSVRAMSKGSRSTAPPRPRGAPSRSTTAGGATSPGISPERRPRTTKDTVFGCGCTLLLGLGLVAVVYLIAMWFLVEKELASAGKTALTVMVMLVLLSAFARRKK